MALKLIYKNILRYEFFLRLISNFAHEKGTKKKCSFFYFILLFYFFSAVELAMDVTETLVSYMSINLGSGDVTMT